MTLSPPFFADPTPADFRTRISRDARGLGAGRKTKHRGRRFAALAAAIAVPAMAAPNDWQGFGAQLDETAAMAAVNPMPFEQSGSSFPGSAFYYLEDAPRAAFAAPELERPLFDVSGTGDADADPASMASISSSGPSARSFLAAGSGIDRSRALQCLAAAVYYEAASETIDGQRAVAQVVLNRVAHPTYPNSVCGVVYQGSERRTGCQFSFTCDGSLARKPSASAWSRAIGVAQDALAGQIYSPVGLATHYHTIWIHPYWAPSLDPVGTIGAHRFYRWRGAAGKPAAFRASYAGSEPFASPNIRKNSDLATARADPLDLARSYDSAGGWPSLGSAPAAQTPDRAATPAYSAGVAARGGDSLFTADKLPTSSGIKPEYANSGRWISEPGKPKP